MSHCGQALHLWHFLNIEIMDLLSIIIYPYDLKVKPTIAFAWSFLDIYVFHFHGYPDYLNAIVMLNVK